VGRWLWAASCAVDTYAFFGRVAVGGAVGRMRTILKLVFSAVASDLVNPEGLPRAGYALCYGHDSWRTVEIFAEQCSGFGSEAIATDGTGVSVYGNAYGSCGSVVL
jgi:hypothetical protein